MRRPANASRDAPARLMLTRGMRSKALSRAPLRRPTTPFGHAPTYYRFNIITTECRPQNADEPLLSVVRRALPAGFALPAQPFQEHTILSGIYRHYDTMLAFQEDGPSPAPPNAAKAEGLIERAEDAAKTTPPSVEPCAPLQVSLALIPSSRVFHYHIHASKAVFVPCATYYTINAMKDYHQQPFPRFSFTHRPPSHCSISGASLAKDTRAGRCAIFIALSPASRLQPRIAGVIMSMTRAHAAVADDISRDALWVAANVGRCDLPAGAPPASPEKPQIFAASMGLRRAGHFCSRVAIAPLYGRTSAAFHFPGDDRRCRAADGRRRCISLRPAECAYSEDA